MTHGISKPRFSKENGVFCWVENGTVPSQELSTKFVPDQNELCGDFPSSGESFGKQGTSDCITQSL